MASIRHDIGAEVSQIEPGPTILPPVSDNVISLSVRHDTRAQRAFDLIVATLIAGAVIPVILLAALVIKISDPRSPVLFRQTRYGLHGKPFTILKLRTMVPNAEHMKAELLSQSIGGTSSFKVKNDPRVTRVGRLLRKTYLDELPQVFNVLKGDMSVVGPRARSLNPSAYEPWQRLRLLVRPGITGTWQVVQPRVYDFSEACRMDIDYIRQKSVMKDIRIIAATGLIVLKGGSGD